MAEKKELMRQFEYKATSNLVLTSENRTRQTGPTGEVTSLVGKVQPGDMRRRFGDRVTHGAPTEIKDRMKRAAKKRERKGRDEDEEERPRKRGKTGGSARETVLSTEVGEQVYRPKTRETKAAYSILLTMIQGEPKLSDKPDDVLRGAADEVLSIMKDDRTKDKEKQKQLESLFRTRTAMDIKRFSRYINVCNRLTDYSADDLGEEGKGYDEELGVNIVFDQSEEEEQDDLDEIDDEEDEDGDVMDTDLTIEAQLEDEALETGTAKKQEDLDARDIDAFWLQRRLNDFYKDAHTSQKLASEVFELLEDLSTDDRKTENALVLKLDYDKFDFIKVLLRNRAKIVYCIKLGRADAEGREALQKEMMENPALRPILDEVTRTSTATERNLDLERKLMSEARTLTGRATGSAATDEAHDPFWAKRAKTKLDLDNLTHDKGSHFLSKAEVKLPKSEVINKKGYQEVHVPALKPRGFQPGEVLKPISKLPKWTRKAFPKMESLNRIQSRVCDTALFSAENMLLCAPTGAGKTNVAVLTMLREIGLHRDPNTNVINTDAFKIVYVAPMKSLVQEMVLNFTARFKDYGITVNELSGDQQLTKAQIQETQVIVTTPEKWDIITRKSGDRTYTGLVRLVIIDEIHLLHDDRGPVLESIISRTIRQIETTQELIRIVGLSATLPNYEDVAMLCRVKPDKGLFFFDNSFRPCPLQQQFIGITQKKAFKRMEIMNDVTYEKTMQAAGKHQVLIFVHSRKETATTAKVIRDRALEEDSLAKFMEESAGRRQLLTEEAQEAKNDDLKDLLPYGIAIHHAGMARSDRTMVEDLFAAGHIQVLCSTATLAWGVNLPAHTVIIKGTQIYSPEKGAWVELSPLDVVQMLGRAGRPQYDDYGEGIVITTHKELHFYLSLVNEQMPVESQFISRLPDMLNAEIVLGSVSNVKEAVSWLGYTYLYVRMLHAPHVYQCSLEGDPALEQRRIDLIHTAAVMLDQHNLIKYDRKSGNFQVTDLGRVASHYYISFTSMAVYNEYLKPTMSDIELFRVFSLSAEFKYLSVRQEEKMELAQLLDKVPIPIKESMEEGSAKVNVLLQAYISRLRLDGFALMADMVYITQSAGRILRALYEIVLKRGWAAVAEKTLTVALMIHHRMWAAQTPLRQFRGLPPEILKRIESKDFPWERLYDLDEHALGDLVRFNKLGKVLHKNIHQLPRLEMEAHVQPITRSMLRVELTLVPDFLWEEKIHGTAEPFWVWVEGVDSEQILHHEFFILKRRYCTEEHSLSFTIPIQDPMPPQYYVRIMSDRWLGSQSVLALSFHHLILPEKYPAPTELLDLQPLPVTELGNERFIAYHGSQFDTYNPIQTQVFNSIYKTDGNVLLAAPTGSGKTVCAELAIFRMLQTQPSGRCVYIAPKAALATERYNDWKPKLGQLSVPVTMLTGDITADLKLLAEGQVVISTPEQWDVMSRRWTTRKNVQNVSLFIVDELHLIGGDVGPILEVIVSRMRYISSQLERNIRLLGLLTSVANARDLGLWIGATSSTLYNFHPNVRPVPLEIRVQGFDANHYQARQLAMLKPCYSHIKRHSPSKPVMVFVSGRSQARKVAVELMSMAAAEARADRFLHAEEKELEPHVAQVRNTALKETLRCGIGYLHQGLGPRERKIVQQLYTAGAIQVLVVEQGLCWGLVPTAHLVVIMGAQYFEGRDHRYVDMPITDMLQMMGRACRPSEDTVGKCSIFCHTPKKEFFKKFLYEPFPVESHLDHTLADHLNAEIVTKRVESLQDAVDYLTWTFLYRRITQNPNYYNMQGVSHRHLSDHLSELAESTLNDLEESKCVTIDEEDVAPLNLGMIASYYYIKYTTVERFASSLTAKSKLKGLLHNLCWATEFADIPVRYREDLGLRKLAAHLPLKIEEAGNYNDPNTKANVLLQAHFSRTPLSAAVSEDQAEILPKAVRLLQAMVDVISSKGWLKPALACMELAQMVTQGMWRTDSPLLQLPFITKEMATVLEKGGVETIYDFLEMEDADRTRLCPLEQQQMSAVAQACNAYPNIEVKFEIVDSDDLKSGHPVTIQVQLERDEDEELKGAPRVHAPRYPQIKNEGWWLVVGDKASNSLVSIKRVAMKRTVTNAKLQFPAPPQGKYNYQLMLMCDSYLGADQEYEFDMSVAEGMDVDEEESSSEEESD